MQQWQYQILAEPVSPALYTDIPMPDAWTPHWTEPAPVKTPWLYDAFTLVVAPAEVPVEDVMADHWYVQTPHPHFIKTAHHSSFFGEPWNNPTLYEIPELDKWWNKTLDEMPVYPPVQIPPESFVWYPQDYAPPEATSMASWWTPAGEQLQSDKFRDSYFTIGLPPELTFTTPDCPHRMPRSDDEDELRFRTH